MTRKKLANNPTERRILGRVDREEFVGRASELERIVRVASNGEETRGLLLLLAPTAGVSELMRQAYDDLFNARAETVPIYFQISRNDQTSVGAARQFLHTFLKQLVAFRRNDPKLVDAALTTNDLLELAAPSDYEWMERLLEIAGRDGSVTDELDFVRLCFSAPQRAAAQGTRIFTMLDGVQLAEHLKGDVFLAGEVAHIFTQSNMKFALAGLRRQILDVVHDAGSYFDNLEIIHLERLNNADARSLVQHVARRQSVALNDQTADLIVQQFQGSPFFITSLVQTARERNIPLTSFVNCQQLYVDELMGGRISRHFNGVLEEIAPLLSKRRALVRLLYESSVSVDGKAPLEVWRKRLDLDAEQFQKMTQALHRHELVSLNANYLSVGKEYPVWSDYLHTRYRLEVAIEPRALVVAETLLEVLKRAPQTMARHYRREAALGLRQLLSRFNDQSVPASLMHYDRFSRAYKGVMLDEINAGLDAETDLVRLPQIVHVASCAAFHQQAQQFCEEERCAIAHGFDAGNYADANEVVWITAEIESKLEAGRGITEMWCDRLQSLARSCGFGRVKLWLVAPEGFSIEANELLAERDAYGSSRQQLELLTSRLNAEKISTEGEENGPDEFELVIPMGDDTELIAASTVDQIARRVDFQPEAINQIKTALVEACINASEHSLSPDRKIYQRFRVESDKLVVTVSSRGVVPLASNGQNGGQASSQPDKNGEQDSARERRGWGLKLIRSLMDEVEFERVDDGTRLRMTKYLRKQ
ncbi:MAG: ATP-binding protein [Pyrinomonadaceae bacterium]